MTHISAAPASHLAIFAVDSSAPFHHRPAHPQVITKMGDLMVQQTRAYEHERVLSGGERRPENQGLAAGARGGQMSHSRRKTTLCSHTSTRPFVTQGESLEFAAR